VFYEKALFKRGWARFKQEYYHEAVDDYLGAVDYHNFDDYPELTQPQKEQFNEYFRAVGLSFSYLGGAEPLNKYFENNPSFRYIYYSYLHVSDIYLKQQRYSDAVETLKYFITNNKESKDIPGSYLRIVKIWKDAGFAKKAVNEIDNLYSMYHPGSNYWHSNKSNHKIFKNVTAGLKENILLASSYFHKQYRESKKSEYFSEANKWYKRYLLHYKSQAHKDQVYYQYASLLSDARQQKKALKYYELSAFDGDIILNKRSAYAAIVLSDEIHKREVTSINKKSILDKHIKYATLYTQLYPNDKHSVQIILHAAELAFQTKQFNKAIELAETIPASDTSRFITKANIIKAHSYFNLTQYENAEAAYTQALSTSRITKKTRKQLSDKLALSIYKQAENADKNKDIQKALKLYSKISTISPTSSVAATGLYDGIALSMKHKLWSSAIQQIQKFQSIYPRHKYSGDITKKLSVAYLNSNQGIKAAQAFEKISGFEKDKNVKIAALWQAAELYESKDDISSAIRSYEKYVHKYKKPFPQFMEAMSKLSELYLKSNNHKKASFWNREIIKQDKKVIKS
jgi:tetratricopeptide (TPR) repeat protein